MTIEKACNPSEWTERWRDCELENLDDIVSPLSPWGQRAMTLRNVLALLANRLAALMGLLIFRNRKVAAELVLEYALARQPNGHPELHPLVRRSGTGSRSRLGDEESSMHKTSVTYIALPSLWSDRALR